MSTIRPYLLYGVSQTAPIETRSAAIVTAWLDDWACRADVAPPAVRVLSDPINIRASNVLCLRQGAELWCAIALPPEFQTAVNRTLFDLPAARASGDALGVIADVIESALADLAARLIAGDARAVADSFMQRDKDGLPEEFGRPGSGCIALTVSMAEFETRVWLSRAVMDGYLKRQPAHPRPPVTESLVSAVQAIGAQTVAVNVRIGDADLTLGELAVLSVGDVIRLDNRVDDCAELVFEGSSTKCLGQLGMHDGKYALRIESVVQDKS